MESAFANGSLGIETGPLHGLFARGVADESAPTGPAIAGVAPAAEGQSRRRERGGQIGVEIAYLELLAEFPEEGGALGEDRGGEAEGRGIVPLDGLGEFRERFDF